MSLKLNITTTKITNNFNENQIIVQSFEITNRNILDALYRYPEHVELFVMGNIMYMSAFGVKNMIGQSDINIIKNWKIDGKKLHISGV